MQVLKIVAEGLTTSFRQPHFIQQVQPTFLMPPPATIYGHIASSLGDWFDPTGVQFAYHFTFEAKKRDLEHTIILSPKGGKLFRGSPHPKNLQGKINPFDREILFHPRLILYLNKPEWLPHFLSPRYAVALGRSQDLFTYSEVSNVSTVKASEAYFEHTLLPYSASRRTSRGYAVTMPRFLDYHNKRFPSFAQYLVVQERIFSAKDFLWFGHKPTDEYYWIDPQSPEVQGARLGLSWLSFVGEQDEAVRMA